MYRSNFLQDSDIRHVFSEPSGKYHIIEYDHDISPGSSAVSEYFMGKMNIRKKQLAVNLRGDSVIMQAGAMQWFAGNINVKTDIKGVGDFAKKMFGGKVSGESGIKPKYEGEGIVVLEPTYKYLILTDLMSEWGKSGVVAEDGMFLACDGNVNFKIVARKSVSSAVAGNEGLFNLCLSGEGIVAFESPVPEEELVKIQLENDCLKVDGSYAICWSRELDFTVERTTKTLIGSAASGEGLVNVYRGTGTIWLAPIR